MLCAMAAVTAPAFAGEGWPKRVRALCPVSKKAPLRRAGSMPERDAASRKMSGSPAKKSERPRTAPSSAAHALTAISGPIPAGSPMLTRIERASARLDNAISPQIAQIAPRQDAKLLIQHLLPHLFPGRDLRRHHAARRGIATHEQLDADARRSRCAHAARRRLGNGFSEFGRQFRRLDLAEVEILQSLRRFHDRAHIGAGADAACELPREIR